MQIAAEQRTSAMSPMAHKMLLELGTSGTAVCIATASTNPIDVVKIRVQLQSSAAGSSASLIGTGVNMVRYEGATLGQPFVLT
jgi:hypothetical protein